MAWELVRQALRGRRVWLLVFLRLLELLASRQWLEALARLLREALPICPLPLAMLAFRGKRWTARGELASPSLDFHLPATVELAACFPRPS